MNEYLFTVIVPTFNRANLLKKTITLLARQTIAKKMFEAIVISDGSTDHTDKVIQDLQAVMPFPLKYLKQRNQGPASARNLAILKAQGKFVLFMGDDTFPAEDLLELHADVHRDHEDVAVLGKVEWSPEIAITPFMHMLAPDGFQFRYSKIRNPENCGFRFFYTSNISLPRSWLNGSLFDAEFPYGALEDAELGYRLEKRGLRIRYNEKALTYHNHAMTLSSFSQRMKLVGRSAVILVRKHPELKKFYYPIYGKPAGIVFSQLKKAAILAKIHQSLYWKIALIASYLEGFKEGRDPERKY
jgi:glycosyltransferase involved in cell wall biosynthesis